MTIIVNNHKIKTFNFPGGECHVSIANIEIKKVIDVEANLYNSADVMSLLMTVNAIRQVNDKAIIYLEIPYFPYARQDRVSNPGEALSISVMTQLINALVCEEVTIYDPHSLVTPDLLNNCIVISQKEIITGSIVSRVIYNKELILVSPDEGAINKTRDLARYIKAKAIYCEKVRDTKTGEITKVDIPYSVTGASFMVVDDICDGGRTFIELAKRFKDAGANDLYLYVTHGIFSNGLSELRKYYKHIYCYHCFFDPNDTDKEILTVLRQPNN